MDARWQIGPVKDISKAIDGYSDYELAYLIGFGMWQNAKDGVFYGSVGSMARLIWPEASNDLINRCTKGTARRLRAAGFTPENGKLGFRWRVPADMSQWQEPEKHRDQALHTGAPSESGPVETSYTCMVPECGSRGQTMTKEERASHYRKHHRSKTKITESKVPADATETRIIERSSPSQDALLQAIMRHSGDAPRDYARRLGKTPDAVSHLAGALKKAGLIYSVGNRSSVRYYLAGTTRVRVDGISEPKRERKKVAEPVVTTPVEPSPKVTSAERKLVDPDTGEELVFKNGKLYRVITQLEEVT